MTILDGETKWNPQNAMKKDEPFIVRDDRK